MAKHSLNKTIEARKMNKKTGAPIQGPESTISYGAIIEDPRREGGMWYFTHNLELYRCAIDVLTSALDRGELDGGAAPKSAIASEPTSPAPAAPSLRWQEVASTHHPVLRSKVPGGWLLASGPGPFMMFYPDPEHRWNGASLD